MLLFEELKIDWTDLLPAISTKSMLSPFAKERQ